MLFNSLTFAIFLPIVFILYWTITYYPADWFSDGVHFKKDILKKYGEDIKEAVLD